MKRRTASFVAMVMILSMSLSVCAAAGEAEAAAESTEPAEAVEEPAEKKWHSCVDYPIWTDTVGASRKNGLTGGKISYSYPTFTVGESGMEELQETLDTYSESLEKMGKAFAKDQEVYFMQTFKDGTGLDTGESSSLCSSRIVRADEGIVSILTTTDTYTWPGAHGMQSYEGLNVDPATGEILTVKDVVLTPEALPDILDEAFARQDDPTTLYSSVKEVTQQMLDDGSLCFVVGMEGVTFVFPAYSLRAYVFGATAITLYYEEYPELFAEGIPFTGNYFTQLQPYFECGYFENGASRSYTFSDMIEEYRLYYRTVSDEWICAVEEFYTDIDNSLYLVRTDGTHAIYVRTDGWIDEADPGASFRALTAGNGGTLVNANVDPEILPYLLEPIEKSAIELDVFNHPERVAFALYANGETGAYYETEDGAYGTLWFEEDEEERHAFADLDGDGVDEMYMENTSLSWPYSFYVYDYGMLRAAQLEEGGADAGMEYAGEEVFLTEDGRVVVHEKTEGRESCGIYRFTENRRFAKEAAYTRVWDPDDRSGEDGGTCTAYAEGKETEISAEEFAKAVDEALALAVEWEFVN